MFNPRKTSPPGAVFRFEDFLGWRKFPPEAVTETPGVTYGTKIHRIPGELNIRENWHIDGAVVF